MANRAILEATRIASETQKSIDAAYDGVLKKTIEKHRVTLEKIEKLKAAGKRGAARALFRSSGMLEDLARAIATAGHEAKALVLQQNQGIVGVMMDDDGS